MPPNAQRIGGAAIAAKANAAVANDTYLPTFSGAIDVSLSEVAKTFRWREIGNGSANGGGGGSAPYADCSTLGSTVDNVAYVMDDGLTSLSGESAVANNYPIGYINQNGHAWFLTFIGTGLTFSGRNPSNAESAPVAIAQNLPYGTHVVRIGSKSGAHIQTEIKVDGVEVYASASGLLEYAGLVDLTFHQPKMPPIPEDACILADYMLMAEFKPVAANGGQYISKGVRGQALSRDVFADANAAFDAFSGANISSTHAFGYRLVAGTNANSATSTRVRLPSFATNFVARAYQFGTRHDLYIGTTIQSSNQTIENSPNSTAAYDTYAYLTSAQNLGAYDFGFNAKNGTALNASALEIATPIHTSSHYQEFETTYLKELVGGDRNMEQTNLIVTPDGKSWDEVTRDTSYIGNVLVTTDWTSQNNTNTTVGVGDEFRGREASKNLFVKDFAIAHDRLICLVDGHYQIIFGNHMNADSGGHYSEIRINGTAVRKVYYEGSGNGFIHGQLSIPLKRGDYVDHKGMHFTNETWQFQINRIK